MSYYFITGNNDKLKEAKSILGDVNNINLDLPEIQSLDPQEIIKEKLKIVTKEHNGKFFVEDTSLYIECLNGFPGPLIKFFLQSLGNQGIYDLVKKYQNKNAIAKTVIGYSNGRDVHFFTGVLYGKIVSPLGNNGFGWDRIFMPDGHNKTLAEMNFEEKNKISMRKESLRKLKEYLS